ncbi:hypothetical protein [Aquipseudomonas campi]
MHSNPFDIPTSEACAEPVQSGLRPASRLPYAIMGVAALSSLLTMLLSALSVWFWGESDVFSSYLENLPFMFPGWISGVLLACLGTLLLSRSYLERHGIAAFRQPLTVLGMYALLSVVCSLVLWQATVPLFGASLEWSNELTGSYTLALLLNEPMHWLNFALSSLVPLWLIMHVLRTGAQLDSQARVIPRWEAALAYSLCVEVVFMSILVMMPMLFGVLYDIDWLFGLYVVGVLGLLLLVFLSAWLVLPVRLARLNAGRLVLASLLSLVLWGIVVAVVLAGLVIAVVVGANIAPVLLGLIGFGLLVLLWFFTRLGLRWVYRAEPA